MFMRIGFALITSLLATGAFGSDWNYAGYVKANGIASHQFFDAQTVTYPTRESVRVWVRSTRSNDLDRFYKNHQKLVVEKSAQKIAAGYGPRFLDLEEVRSKYTSAQLKDALVELTSYEVIANEPDVQTNTKLYFEIDCSGQRIKLLSGTKYSASGEVLNSGVATRSEYDFIQPDSNGQWLSQMLCMGR